MPELPEVELARKVAESVVTGREISRAKAFRDDIVFEGVGPTKVRRSIEGRVVRAVRRRGKHLWFEFEDPPHLLFHLGMTGRFWLPGEAPLRLEADGDRSLEGDWPPRFVKLLLETSDGGAIAFTNARRLGRIRFREDPLNERPIRDLGFDPLLDLPSPKEFRRLLSRRSLALKVLLLDQKFAAGVGNWIADEVLYQAKLDPRRKASTLTEAEARDLRRALSHVIKRAVAVDADKDRLPKTWLFHHRWGRQEGAKTARGEKIEFLTQGGRTTAWVPSVQSRKRPSRSR